MNKFVISFFIILSFVACHRKKIGKTPVPPPPPVITEIQSLKNAVDSSTPQFNWFRVKAGTHMQNPENSYSAVIQFKLRDDSLIWGSANMMIEIVRFLVLNDSAHILNRTNKTYSNASFGDLQGMLMLPGLDLKALQNLLMAIPPFSIQETAKLTKTDAELLLVENKNSSYFESMTLDPYTFRLQKYVFEKNNNQRLTVNYKEFTLVKNVSLPQQIEFLIETPDKIILNLNLSDHSFVDEDTAPFSIPSNYSRP